MNSILPAANSALARVADAYAAMGERSVIKALLRP